MKCPLNPFKPHEIPLNPSIDCGKPRPPHLPAAVPGLSWALAPAPAGVWARWSAAKMEYMWGVYPRGYVGMTHLPCDVYVCTMYMYRAYTWCVYYRIVMIMYVIEHVRVRVCVCLSPPWLYVCRHLASFDHLPKRAFHPVIVGGQTICFKSSKASKVKSQG